MTSGAEPRARAARVRAWRQWRVAAMVIVPNAIAAQSRTIDRRRVNEPEGQLLVYYASVLANSPAGMTPARGGADADGVMVAVEGSYIPRLSLAQRTAEGAKPEATNLAPVFVRPRVRGDIAGWQLEGSWVPPVRTFGVTANLVSVAVSRSVATVTGVAFAPRVSFLTGRVAGAITCNDGLVAGGSSALLIYYANVCHGRNSDDHFEPREIAAEVGFSRTSAGGRFTPYITLGARNDHTRFDIGVIRDDGSRDPDHPILELRTTRGYGTAGVAWRCRGRLRLGGELYYAPGSLFTARALAGIRLW
jgi:hypothetical protein